MDKFRIIKKTEEFVKKTMKGDSGHDWFHIDRVRNAALFIGKKEKADLFKVELAALLHDVGDYKFHNGRDDAGSEISRKFLKSIRVDDLLIEGICEIVDAISFKGAKSKSKIETIEGRVVQDADRLDALGAIGVARVFAFAGFRGQILHDPKILPNLNKTVAQYKKADNTPINHFYEKLLLIKDLMHTKTAKKIAQRRHKFMETYLKEFLLEWDGAL